MFFVILANYFVLFYFYTDFNAVILLFISILQYIKKNLQFHILVVPL